MKTTPQKEDTSKNVCNTDGWCTWGAIFRIAIAVLLVVGAFSLGIKIGTGHDRDGGRYGGMGYDRDGRGDERRGEHTPPMNCPMMQSGKMGMSGSHDMMDMSMRDMGKMLEGKTGADLNKAFLEGMIPHHQGAIEMAAFLAASDKPELVKLGADIIAAQQKEIDQMNAWIKDWGYTQTGTTNTGAMNMHMMPDGTMMQH